MQIFSFVGVVPNSGTSHYCQESVAGTSNLNRVWTDTQFWNILRHKSAYDRPCSRTNICVKMLRADLATRASHRDICI